MIALDPLALPLRGLNLIEASAGTGKTFTITTLYLRMLLETERRIGEILVVTYTNAATAELRTRLRLRLANALAAVEAAAAGRALAVGDGVDAVLASLIDRRAAAGSLERDRHRLTAALYGFDDAAVFTIHGFCQRVLQEHAFESGMPFDAQLVTDQRSLVREIVRDFWVRELHAAPRDFVAFVQSQYDIMEDLTKLALKVVGVRDVPVLPELEVLPAAEVASPAVRLLRLRVSLVHHVRNELRLSKEKANVLYFDDLLTRLRDGLAGAGGALLAEKIRERYRAALIDEFQDTDPVQYEIFSRIYRGSTAPLFLIGDPKQAIYAFRGADVFTYVDAKTQAGDEHSRTLGTNHRSDPKLVDAVNAIFSRAEVRDPFLLTEIGFDPARARDGAENRVGGCLSGAAPLQILYLRKGNLKSIAKGEGRARLVRDIPNEIARFLASDATIDGEPPRPSHIAVLCRKNDEARALQRELRRLRIPSVLQTDESVLETNEAGELQRLVRALAEPGDAGAIIAALATPMLGVSAVEIQALRDGGTEWDQWTERFHRWQGLWLTAGFMPAFRTVLEGAEVERRVLGGVDGERRMTNFLHLGEILQTAAIEMRRGPLALSEWFDEVCADREARTDALADVAQIRLESDDRALKLLTIHKSKGLEYPVVFCPFLWDGRLLLGRDDKEVRFHDPKRDNALMLDIGAPPTREALEQAKREALAENLRLLYVALTRAKHRCVVAWGLFNESDTSALGYLLHQDPSNGGDVAARTSERIKGLDDEGMLEDLRRLVADAGGAIEIAPLSDERGPVYQRGDADAAIPLCREPERSLRLGWRTASFSSLTAGGAHVSDAAEEGVDRDETDTGEDAGTARDLAPSAPILLADFPAGTRAGQLVHAIFEHLDFTAPETLQAVAAEQVAAYGFDAACVEPLVRGIGAVLDTPLTAGRDAFRLRDIGNAARLNELEFLFSLHDPDTDGAGLDSGALARVFARPGSALRPEYQERLRHLGFAPLSGYLKGFVDLVFRHADRWYVVDWKSNHLGIEARAYEPGRLGPAMEQHHYFLQYHLYTVALHRYLRLRLPGYDYERDFGGVFYLFVRGMAPEHAAGTGVFFDRPPRALIEDLSELM